LARRLTKTSKLNLRERIKSTSNKIRILCNFLALFLMGSIFAIDILSFRLAVSSDDVINEIATESLKRLLFSMMLFLVVLPVLVRLILSEKG